MSVAAQVAGYVWLAVIGLAVVLCVLAVTVNAVWEAREQRQHRRHPVAPVIHLPVQPTHVRVVTDRQPSA